MVFEIRQTATPAMANGGGFNPDGLGSGGQDFSQQDAAQYNLTLVTTAGADAVLLSASAATVMIGNIAHIVSGTNFIVGWYEITAVTVGVSITLDRNCTTAAGATGVVNIGGALSLNSTIDDEWGETLAAGNKVWVRYNATNILLAESITLTTAAGTAALVITFEGYTTTRGDLGTAVLTSSNTPTIACGTSFTFTTPTFTNIKFINFTGASTSVLTAGSNNKVIGCKSVQISATATRTAIAMGSNGSIIRCEAISYRGYAIGTTSGSIGCLYNYCHDSDIGIRSTSVASFQCIGNIVAANVTAAIAFTAATTDLRILKNTLYGQPGAGGIGLSLATGITNVVLMNNILMEFTRGVVHADVTTSYIDDFNCYRDNDLSNTNWDVGPNTTTNDPLFTDVGLISFSDGTTSGSVLTSASSDFSAVTDGVDFVYLSGGTGIVVGKYRITAHAATTLTLEPAPVANATPDTVGSVVTGMDFLPTGNI